MVDIGKAIDNVERKEVKVERPMVEINGKEFDAERVVSLLVEISVKDNNESFEGLWKSEYEEIAEVLLEVGVIKETVGGSWCEVDDNCDKMISEIGRRLGIFD